MSIRFRVATRVDVPKILALYQDDTLGAAREGAKMERYLAAFDAIQVDPDNTLIVGEREGAVIATYQLTLIPGLTLRATTRAQIEGVRVRSDLRGQGLGAAMIADAEDRARAAGCTLLQLTMNASRTDTARFYQRLGFTPSHIGYKRDLT
ncbi:GNAT family N-acetyltransferase [uncultured Tateyamaria sp.]|uniref:GNAT family N-acetyltransferase n=1 Tax=uncultured Tateyamaria sp. TaxID=455651 RepID=UPI00262D60D4|nr:GNAT family N-acetyltransferase [uncultured Tateyamaria sp.]